MRRAAEAETMAVTGGARCMVHGAWCTVYSRRVIENEGVKKGVEKRMSGRADQWMSGGRPAVLSLSRVIGREGTKGRFPSNAVFTSVDQ